MQVKLHFLELEGCLEFSVLFELLDACYCKDFVVYAS